MNKLLLVYICIVLLTACKETKEDKIRKKWVAVSVENPELDKQVADLRAFYDTVGRSTDPSTNLKLYGASNLDSLRQMLISQLDSAVAMQKGTVNNTWMDFGKDSIVAATFGDQPDTVKWYFDDEGNLMLDEMAMRGAGSKIKMEVVKLEDTVLQLRFNENGFSSLATFRPEK